MITESVIARGGTDRIGGAGWPTTARQFIRRLIRPPRCLAAGFLLGHLILDLPKVSPPSLA